MKTLLIDLDPRVLTDRRIDVALDVAGAFGSHLIGLQVTPIDAYASMDGFGGVFAMPQVLEAVSREEGAIRAAFEERMTRAAMSWEYRHSGTYPAVSVATHSMLADLAIVGKPRRTNGDRKDRIAHVGELVMASVTPVLAVPPEVGRFDPFGPALVLWNGSGEAAAAVRGALPLLRQASDVTILIAEEDSRYELPATGVAEYLSRHGVRAEIVSLPVRDADVPNTLLWAIAERDPAFVVMGAYGHSRFREWLLGGVTRRLLADLPTPLLMAR